MVFRCAKHKDGNFRFLVFILVAVFVFFPGLTVSAAESEGGGTPPSNRAEMKDLLQTALFSPTWRAPHAVEWVVRIKKTTPVAVAIPSDSERDKFVLAYQRLSRTLARLQDQIGFPFIDFSKALLTVEELFALGLGDDPYVLIFSEPPVSFAKEMDFLSWRIGDSLMNVERYIKRGCFFPPGSSEKGFKSSVLGFVQSDLPDPQFDKCIADILYLAHGIWAEDVPHKDIVLKIMYDPMVRPGMTREALFELVDHGVFDHLLAR